MARIPCDSWPKMLEKDTKNTQNGQKPRRRRGNPSPQCLAMVIGFGILVLRCVAALPGWCELRMFLRQPEIGTLSSILLTLSTDFLCRSLERFRLCRSQLAPAALPDVA